MITRRNFINTVGLGVLSLKTSLLHATTISEKPTRPDIVFILADDMGWSDIAPYGGEIATPNLDRLAGNGIRFTQFHNTSKCFPSRACLLTGLYAQQCGMDKKPGKFKNAVTLGDVLRSAGYRTLATGKHHSTQNLFDIGFDRYFGLRDGACNYFNPGKQRPGEPSPASKSPAGTRKRAWCIDKKTFTPYTPKEKDFYTTDYFTKYALSYLEEYKDEKKPFFLYLAYNAPHDPLQAWPEDIKKYETRYIDGWEKLRKARYKRQQQLGIIDETMPLSKPSYRQWDNLNEAQRKIEAKKMAVYAAMIDRMDQNIGKILAKLESLGKLENTLILFASDNGCSPEVPIPKNSSGEIGSLSCWSSLGPDWANTSNTPYRYYKNDSYEGGICTPFIAHWPKGIKNAGRISHHVGHFIDIMATFIDLSGAQYPDKFRGENIIPYEGESLLPIFKDREKAREKPLFWQWRFGKAVRKNKWKLVSRKENGKEHWSLFDMEKDKTETSDLSSEYPETVAALKSLHKNWRKRCASERVSNRVKPIKTPAANRKPDVLKNKK